MLRVLILWLLFLPFSAMAQGAATLVADTITVGADRTLTAQGNVQVFYDGTTLSAQAIRYSQSGDTLSITGPIFIRAPDGTVLTAEAAQLDPQLENGILRGARLVLNQQLQLAANRIDRVDGRYSQLTRTVATSCQICATEAPLWEIRADRIIHDELERQLYFDNATFHIRGVPLLWVPRLRLPDPTLDRATGLLIPRLRSNNQLGVGIKLPYFIRIGDSRDLTLTPFLTSETTTLEARYRQAFLSGTLEINAAASRDTLRPGELRSYVIAEGQFDLGRDFQLNFDIEGTTDPAYLLEYGYSSKDRLDSAIAIERVRDRDLFVADITYFDSLRDDEADETLPPIVVHMAYDKRLFPEAIGGTLTFGASLDAFERTIDTPGADGRDVARVGLSGAWHRNWTLPNGLIINASTALEVDYFAVRQDPAYETGLRAIPSAAATLRWPLIRRMPTGTVHILEPAISLGWTQSYGTIAPNEDGTLAEFDEANLFALTRFPGEDAREDRSHTSIGVTWTRIGASGARSSLTFGRLFQDTQQPSFSPTSGLSQLRSDWLVSGSLALSEGLQLDGRALFDDDFEFDKTEVRLNWQSETLSLAAAYHWLPEDPTRERLEPASEWSFDGSYIVDEHWTVNFDGRYDVAADQPRTAGLGVEWRNECVTVDLSVSRRYTNSDTTDPSTDFGFGISLTGFSAGRSTAQLARSCSN